MSANRGWSAVSLKDAGRLIDMSSGQQSETWQAIAKEQLLGAVDLYDRLGQRDIAWLCDEVGLGKTYVAMAVAALMRRQHPGARILYLLPTSRLLPKWTRELSLFSRRNVRSQDHVLRTLQERPARPLVPVQTLHELALESTLEPDRDFLCTLGAFSFALPSRRAQWRQTWDQLLRLLPANRRHGLSFEAIAGDGAVEDTNDEKLAVKVAVAEVINRILPDFDLVICDESHNLREGLQSSASRNRLLSVSLGGVYCDSDLNATTRRLTEHTLNPLRRRARRVLMLTATPFRSEFAELARQAAVFGFVEQDKNESSPVVEALKMLSPKRGSAELSEPQLVELRDQVARKFIIRRLGTLTVHGEQRSRNQYRTEFRQGGMNAEDPHAALPTPNTRERLLLALVQKRVLDVIQPKSSSTGWRFQMGLLSSFESFGQTLDNDHNKPTPSHEGDASEEGNSIAKREAHALDQLITSYQETFRSRMPHPKLEHVAASIARAAWERGEKCLVFVRRVKTTEELATRITWHYDDYLRRWVHKELRPDLQELWAEVWSEFERYRERLRLPGERGGESARSLFGWYFRDHKTAGDSGHEAIGGSLVKFGLTTKRPWSVLLEDNPVLVLFEHDEARLRVWADERSESLLDGCLDYAFIDQKDGSLVAKRERGAAAWFLAFQAAALDLIADEHGVDSARGRLARELRVLRFPIKRRPSPPQDLGAEARRSWRPGSMPHGSPADWLVLPTLFCDLQRDEHAALRDEIWGSPSLAKLLRGETNGASTEERMGALIERDQRQAVIAQVLRSGRAYLDLWLAVAQVQGGLRREQISLNYEEETHGLNVIRQVVQPKLAELVTAVIARLKRGRPPGDAKELVDDSGHPLTGWFELARVRRHFPLLVTLNFPRMDDGNPDRARDLLRTTLTGLEPAIALHGSSKTERALEQFRMPGFPMVMVATSVVQEGVDLHTFCRTVVHYGIDGSATGTEQRNGRVDRRGSMVSRLLERAPEEKIQVYFPHLRQSLEPIQMAALYQKMNRFLLMANNLSADQVADQQDVLCAISQQFDQPTAYPDPYQEYLKTAFDAKEPESCAELAPLGGEEVRAVDLQLGPGVPGIKLSDLVREGSNLRWRATATLVQEQRIQPLLLQLFSGLDQGRASLVIESAVWPFDVSVQGADKRRRAAIAQSALATVMTKWKRPSGLHLVTRRRSRTRINLLLRSEMPLPAADLDSDAVTHWVCHVARVADELERLVAKHIAARDPTMSEQEIKDHTKDEF